MNEAHYAFAQRYQQPIESAPEAVREAFESAWAMSLKVQIEHPPAGAVESWAQFIGQSLRIDLQQDPDLFERAQ